MGLVLVATGGFLGFDVLRFMSTAKVTQGEFITTTTIKYFAGEAEYHYTSPFPSAMGKQVVMVYSPGDPNVAKIQVWWDLWLTTGVFIAIGMTLMVLGYSAESPDIRQSGERVSADFVSIQKSKLGSRLVCAWHSPYDNKVHEFISAPAKIDPKKLPTDKKITVFVRPHHPDTYVVDLSFLEK